MLKYRFLPSIGNDAGGTACIRQLPAGWRASLSVCDLQGLVCACYNLRATDLLKQLIQAGRARVSPPGAAAGTANASFTAVVELFDAISVYEQHLSSSPAVAPAENQALLVLAEAVRRHAPAVHSALPDVATDAALMLWQSARPLLEGAVAAQDVGAENAAQVKNGVAHASISSNHMPAAFSV